MSWHDHYLLVWMFFTALGLSFVTGRRDGREVRNAGSIVFCWPIIVPYWVIMGPFYLAEYVGKKTRRNRQ